MILEFSSQLSIRMYKDLRKAGVFESGGILMGEHLHGSTFRVVEYSLQARSGSPTHFMRDPEHNQKALNDFLVRTGEDYSKFNYIGEWHSHPSFSNDPSAEDIHTMQSIVEDEDNQLSFAVLLISKNEGSRLKLQALLFRPGIAPSLVKLVHSTKTLKQRFHAMLCGKTS